QLKRDYPDDWGTFVSNSSTVSCFGIMDQFTANYISEMLGKKTAWYQTSSENQSKSRGRSENTQIDKKYSPGFFEYVFGDAPEVKEDVMGHGSSDNESESKNTSEHVVAQSLMATDELRRMKGKCIVIGQDFPVLCDLVPYYTDAEFRGLARQDPRFYPPEPRKSKEEREPF